MSRCCLAVGTPLLSLDFKYSFESLSDLLFKNNKRRKDNATGNSIIPVGVGDIDCYEANTQI